MTTNLNIEIQLELQARYKDQNSVCLANKKQARVLLLFSSNVHVWLNKIITYIHIVTRDKQNKLFHSIPSPIIFLKNFINRKKHNLKHCN